MADKKSASLKRFYDHAFEKLACGQREKFLTEELFDHHINAERLQGFDLFIVRHQKFYAFSWPEDLLRVRAKGKNTGWPAEFPGLLHDRAENRLVS